jgi:5-methylcytosine-specific restriction endonuclease McrA
LIDNAGDNIKGLYRLAIVAGARPSRWRQDLHAALRFRDGDGCGICGYIIDFRLSGMLPGGPTIDHKVSRKNGGAHEWSNIHLTHRRCNSAKAARNLADYLAA